MNRRWTRGDAAQPPEPNKARRLRGFRWRLEVLLLLLLLRLNVVLRRDWPLR